MGIYLIYIIPIVIFSVILLVSKNVIISCLGSILNFCMILISVLLLNIDSHSKITNIVTEFNFNIFNIIIVVLQIIVLILIDNYTKKINLRNKRILSMFVSLIGFLIEVILVKIYFACQ